MKWIGQHIWDFISRFRNDVYLESVTTSTETDMLVVDSDGKITKRAIDGITVDVSDFMTNGVDNRVLTATGADAMNAESTLNFDSPRLTIGSNTDSMSEILMLNDENSLFMGVSNATNQGIVGASDGDVFVNSIGVHNICIGQNNTTNFKIDTNGDIVISNNLNVGSATSESVINGNLTIQNAADNGDVSTLKLYNNRASDGVDDQSTGIIVFAGKDDGTPSEKTFGKIECIATDVSASSEDSKIVFSNITSGISTAKLTLAEQGAESDFNSDLKVTGYVKSSAGPTYDPKFILYNQDDSIASGELLGEISWDNNDSDTTNIYIKGVAAENQVPSPGGGVSASAGSKLEFYTTPNTTAFPLLAATIEQNKDLTLEGDLIVKGNDIKDNDGTTCITFDSSGNTTIANTLNASLTGNVTGNASGSSGSCTGNAATATALETARAINGVDFDGTAAITVTAAGSTLSDTVPVSKGGTGAVSLATDSILTGNGTSAVVAEAYLTYNTSDEELIIGNPDAGDATISRRDSSGTNTAGGNLIIQAGPATGNADGGSIKFHSSTAGSSGSSVQSSNEVASIDKGGNLQMDGDITIGGNDSTEHTVKRAARTSSANGSSLSIKGGDANGTDNAGGNLKLYGGAGTGTSMGGNIFFYTSPATADSDSDLNTYTNSMSFSGADGSLSLGGDLNGKRDNNLNINSDQSIKFKIDADDDQTGQSFAFYNAGTEIASLDESGHLQIDGTLKISGNSIYDEDDVACIRFDSSGNTTVANGLTATLKNHKHFINFGVNLAYNLSRWIPWGSYYIYEQNTNNNPEYTTYVAPYDGKFIKLLLRSEEALGDTEIKIYKVGDGTEEPEDGSVVDDKHVDIASANTSYTYTFDSDATFSAGDAMAVRIHPTTDPVAAGVVGTFVLEFDLTT